MPVKQEKEKKEKEPKEKAVKEEGLNGMKVKKYNLS